MNTRIKKIREKLNLTKKAFGERVGISGDAIGKIEQKNSNPSEQTLMLIEKNFNVNPDYLRKGQGEIFSCNPELTKRIKQIEKSNSIIFTPLLLEILKYDDDELVVLEKQLGGLINSVAKIIKK